MMGQGGGFFFGGGGVGRGSVSLHAMVNDPSLSIPNPRHRISLRVNAVVKGPSEFREVRIPLRIVS